MCAFRSQFYYYNFNNRQQNRQADKQRTMMPMSRDDDYAAQPSFRLINFNRWVDLNKFKFFIFILFVAIIKTDHRGFIDGQFWHYSSYQNVWHIKWLNKWLAAGTDR